MLGDDQPVDKLDAFVPEDGKPSFEAMAPVDLCGPSPRLFGVLTGSGTDDGKNGQNGQAQYNTNNYEDGEE